MLMIESWKRFFESWKRFFEHDAKPVFFFLTIISKFVLFLFLTTMMMNVFFGGPLTLQADNQIKRGEGVTCLGNREHARRAFTALETISFISDSTDGQLNHTTTAVECLQEVVMQRVSYHFGGAQGMDVPNIVGVVAFVVIIFFGAQLLKRSQQPKSHFIPLNDHVRKGRYRQMGGKTRRPVHVNVESTAAKPFVDGEFWDASERRVQWSCYEMEKTSPGGKASPRILKKSKYAGVRLEPLVSSRQ
jgi:NADH:ubiquinone oxidoreductase subunit 5 (subunit L)/multisubunit Na+/H+ antiporter MnhA subunit